MTRLIVEVRDIEGLEGPAGQWVQDDEGVTGGINPGGGEYGQGKDWDRNGDFQLSHQTGVEGIGIVIEKKVRLMKEDGS